MPVGSLERTHSLLKIQLLISCDTQTKLHIFWATKKTELCSKSPAQKGSARKSAHAVLLSLLRNTK